LSTFTTGNFCVNGTLDAKEMTPLGRNWGRWEENIIFTLKKIRRNGMDSGSFL
jgi:hypothetical protein